LTIVDAERVAGLLVTYRKSFVDDAVDRFSEAWLALGPPVQRKEKEGQDEEAGGPVADFPEDSGSGA
jgi:hypothetical protein